MSAHVQFYHLTATPLERALPKLIEKAYNAGHRVLLVEGAEERLEAFNQLLWTYQPGGFLPHGSVKDGAPEEQPVLLAPTPDNRNHADIALITDGTALSDTAAFTRVLDIFDGNDSIAVDKARARWKEYQASGCALSYLRQTEQGAWEEKQLAAG